MNGKRAREKGKVEDRKRNETHGMAVRETRDRGILGSGEKGRTGRRLTNLGIRLLCVGGEEDARARGITFRPVAENSRPRQKEPSLHNFTGRRGK